MRIVSHRLIPGDSALREQWNLLVDQMERPEVFYTHQWAQAVQHAYRDSLAPWLFLQYEGEELRGVVALATAQGIATFLSGTTADYCDFISQPADRARLIDAVFRELHTAGVKEIVCPICRLIRRVWMHCAQPPVDFRIGCFRGWHISARRFGSARTRTGSNSRRG